MGSKHGRGGSKGGYPHPQKIPNNRLTLESTKMQSTSISILLTSLLINAADSVSGRLLNGMALRPGETRSLSWASDGVASAKTLTKNNHRCARVGNLGEEFFVARGRNLN